MNEKPIKIEKIQIEKLTADEQNAKIHTDAQVNEIVASIKRFGFNDPVGVWGENNLIVEGHGRVQAAKKMGLKEIPCVRLDHLTEDERKAYALVHNSTNMETGFDEASLLATLKELQGKIDMGDFGLVIPEVDDAQKAVEDNYEMKEAAPLRVKLGEVWELGRHTLVCGDSTDEETLNRGLGGGRQADACVTDPPYNVDYTGKTADELKVANDRMSGSEFRDFLTAAFRQIEKHVKPGGAFYVWFASRNHADFEAALRTVGLIPRQQLIWVKNVLVLGRQDYQWKHEPCLYGWKDGAAHYFRDDRTQVTVQESDAPENPAKMKRDELVRLCKELLRKSEITESTVIREDKPSASEIHPTMKPIRLMARLIANSTKPGETIIDPFGGSGSTLIACEQLGRRCVTVELDERYASAIVDRWEQLTGQKARRV